MSLLSRFYPRGPINLSGLVRELPADGSVPGMPGWQSIHTPGHTAGHISLFRESDRALIAGDAFVTVRQESALSVLLQDGHVRRPPAYYTTDWDAARESVAKLASLRPETGVTGHGPAITGATLRDQLTDLVERWNEVARPSYGRYVQQPARTDTCGVLSIPPAVIDRQLMGVAAAGLALLVMRTLRHRAS
jgi:glyoxylase-like metal-dependent hydrolase (beta-lactamase superfamily II)